MWSALLDGETSRPHCRTLERWIRNPRKPRDLTRFRIHDGEGMQEHAVPRRTSTARLPQALVLTSASVSTRPA